MNANSLDININDDNLEMDSLATVKKLFEQYPNMKQKIHHYIKNILPGVC